MTTNRDMPIEIAILSSAVDPTVTLCVGSDEGHPKKLMQNLNIPMDTIISLESHSSEEVATLDLNYLFKDEESYEKTHEEVERNLIADEEEWNEAEDAHYLSLHYTQSQTILSHHAIGGRTTLADLSSVAIPETSDHPAPRASSNSARGSYSASSGFLSKSINGDIADQAIVQQMSTPATTKCGTALGPRYKSLYEIGMMEKLAMGDEDVDEDVTDFGKLLKRRRQKHDPETEKNMELEEKDVLGRPGYSRLIADEGNVQNQDNMRSRLSKRKRGSSQNIIIHQENSQLTENPSGLKRRRSALHDQQEESSTFGATVVSTLSKRLRRNFNEKRATSDTPPLLADNGKRKMHVDKSSQRKACVERKFLVSAESPRTGADESKKVSGSKRKGATMNGREDIEEDLPKNRAVTDRATPKKKEKRNIEIEIEIPTFLENSSLKRAKDNATCGTNMETTLNLSQVQQCVNCGTTDSILWNKNSNGDGIVCDDCGQKTFIVFSTMGTDGDNVQDDAEKSGDDVAVVPIKGRRGEMAPEIGNATANHRNQVRLLVYARHVNLY